MLCLKSFNGIVREVSLPRTHSLTTVAALLCGKDLLGPVVLRVSTKPQTNLLVMLANLIVTTPSYAVDYSTVRAERVERSLA